MKYPIKTDVFIKAAETQLGPVDDTVKKLFSLYIDEVNRAYTEGYKHGCDSKKTEADNYKSALQALAETDVVEVVRCIDCAFYSSDRLKCDMISLHVPNFHFCSYGKKGDKL